MPVLPSLTPNSEERMVLYSWLDSFRDSGCRIVVPTHYSPLLINKISGHFIIAPSGIHERLGFEFDPEHRASPNTPLPSIKKFDEFIGVYLMGSQRHEAYLIYPGISDRDSKNSMVNACNGMYCVDVGTLLKHGAVKRCE